MISFSSRSSSPLVRCAAISGLLICQPMLLASPPAWWSQGNPSVVDPLATENNKGVANIGQAKWMARNALQTLRFLDPRVANLIEEDLVGLNKPIRTWGPPLPGSPAVAEQRSPLKIGQLKAISAPFYKHLATSSPGWLADQRYLNGTQDPSAPAFIYPWTDSLADDFNHSPATIGQLKAVFSLRFEDLYVPGQMKIAAGNIHSLALAEDGRMWSWGGNGHRQLGMGIVSDREDEPGPVKIVSGMGKIEAISVWEYSNAALDRAGKVWVWGYNLRGQLGLPMRGDRLVPIPTQVNVPAMKMISIGGEHCIAVDENNNLWAWGDNSGGCFGIGRRSTNPAILLPQKITGLPSQMGAVTQVAAGSGVSYLLDSNEKVWVCGLGPLGLGVITQQNTFTQIISLPPIRRLSVGNNHVIAEATNGVLYAWGDNTSGKLGDGTTIYRSSPVLLSSPTNVTTFSSGPHHTLASSGASSYSAWGLNTENRFGSLLPTSSSSPISINVPDAVAMVTAGERHSHILLENGSVLSAGANYRSELGIGTAGGNSGNPPINSGYSPPYTGILEIKDFNLGKDDSDNDGLPDRWERFYFSNLAQSGNDDYNNDGVTNLQKYRLGLNPLLSDNDADGMPDYWEIMHGLDPLDPADANSDLDGDGLRNLDEFLAGSSPNLIDSNSDGLLDGNAGLFGTSPLSLDPDGDTLSFAEEEALGTNPFLKDTDGDGEPDNTDAFPLDPTRKAAPPATSGDVTAPDIILSHPQGATLVP